MTSALLIVAAGQGKRFGHPKWSLSLAGKSLLQWNLETAKSCGFIDHIVLVVHNDHKQSAQAVCNQYPELKISIAEGGEERIDSVQSGLALITEDLVFIHNVANPMASREDFQKLHEILMKEDCAAFVGQPVVDTLRRVDDSGSSTIDRNAMWRVQTPQGFRVEKLKQQLEQSQGKSTTDEVVLYEDLGLAIHAFPTSAHNQKITYPEDLELLERSVNQQVLVGIGEDSHPLDETGEMMLGGIKVAGLPKLKGNSDGDLVLHSIFNAISSALGQRSIGPTADPLAEQGVIDSSEYVKIVLESMHQEGYRLNNVSISLECQRPKVEPLADQMKERLSELLELDRAHIGITATTGEGMGDRAKEAVFCRCVISLVKI